MELISVSGAYSADNPLEVKRNILTAEEYSVELIKQGYGVFTPHKNFAGYEVYGISWETIMKICLAFNKGQSGLAMLPNWEKSKGANIEHERAEEWGKKVIYL